jgi:replicative DNA helicase
MIDDKPGSQGGGTAPLDFNAFAREKRPEDRKGGRGQRERKPLGSLFEKLPPHSAEAEMSLLGSMILDPRVIGDVIGMVREASDFYVESHGWIYRALVEVFDRHHTGDLVQLQDWLRTKGVYDTVGGDQYLMQLAESVPSAVNAPHYARIVAEKAKLRRLIDAAGQMLYDAYHAGELGPEGSREVLDGAQQSIFKIAETDSSTDAQSLKQLLQAEMDRLEAQDGKGYSGIATGYYDLDAMMSGLQRGEFIVIAARPSMGKTALALNLAEQIAFGGHPIASGKVSGRVPVAVFSLEMSKEAVTQRLISARTGIPSQSLRSGHGIDFRKIIMACSELEQAPVYIDDTPGMTIMQLRARARRLVAQHDVQCIMIDYLQLLSAPGAARESRQVEVSTISRQVKALARELNVPVICLSQLNRASEQREGNRPRMSDLRESGSIEQDADVVALLHREEYYHTQDPEWFDENPDKVGVAELILAKQRNGPTGVVKLRWDKGATRFKNYMGGDAPPELSGNYTEPSRAAESWPGKNSGTPQEPAPEPKPYGGFSPGKKSGPVSGFRDGGGPDKGTAPEPPPFDDDDPGIPT